MGSIPSIDHRELRTLVESLKFDNDMVIVEIGAGNSTYRERGDG
jgi:hypothetical protein